ncbi:unnamed protein product [Dicrocoelium dendriticum]|nr:unnamed protein product [Dicrocoelium dendriticum]
MLWETGSCLIVRLEGSTAVGEPPVVDVSIYWPTIQSARHGFLVVDPIGSYTMATCVMREFRLTDTRDGTTRTIRQFDATQTTDRMTDLEQNYTLTPSENELGVRPAGSELDALFDNTLDSLVGIKHQSFSNGFRQLCQLLCESMLEVVIQVHKTKEHFGMDGPITVHCNYGAGRTGVFLTIALILERMRYEGVVDMFQTVKLLRWQRPGLVRTPCEYAFCYCCALEYIESFERYSN